MKKTEWDKLREISENTFSKSKIIKPATLHTMVTRFTGAVKAAARAATPMVRDSTMAAFGPRGGQVDPERPLAATAVSGYHTAVHLAEPLQRRHQPSSGFSQRGGADRPASPCSYYYYWPVTSKLILDRPAAPPAPSGSLGGDYRSGEPRNRI